MQIQRENYTVDEMLAIVPILEREGTNRAPPSVITYPGVDGLEGVVINTDRLDGVYFVNPAVQEVVFMCASQLGRSEPYWTRVPSLTGGFFCNQLQYCEYWGRLGQVSVHQLLSVAPFISTDKTRGAIRNILLDPDEGQAVATNSHVLSVADAAVSWSGSAKPNGVLVPTWVVQAMKRLSRHFVGLLDLRVSLNGQYLELSSPTARVLWAVTSDRFPRWRRIYQHDDWRVVGSMSRNAAKTLRALEPWIRAVLTTLGAVTRRSVVGALFGNGTVSVGQGETRDADVLRFVDASDTRALNCEYLRSIAAFLAADAVVEARQNRDDPLRFSAGDRHALLMPLQE